MKLKPSPFQKLRPAKQLPFLAACCCSCSCCCVVTAIAGSFVVSRRFKSVAKKVFPESPRRWKYAALWGWAFGLWLLLPVLLLAESSRFQALISGLNGFEFLLVMLTPMIVGISCGARYSGFRSDQILLLIVILFAATVAEFLVWTYRWSDPTSFL